MMERAFELRVDSKKAYKSLTQKTKSAHTEEQNRLWDRRLLHFRENVLGAECDSLS